MSIPETENETLRRCLQAVRDAEQMGSEEDVCFAHARLIDEVKDSPRMWAVVAEALKRFDDRGQLEEWLRRV